MGGARTPDDGEGSTKRKRRMGGGRHNLLVDISFVAAKNATQPDLD